MCASHKLEIQGSFAQDYRICLVNYTHLGPSQRCSRGGIAPDTQCCNTRAAPNAQWCKNYTRPTADDSIPVLNLTTSIEGRYQCQVWNVMMKAWQSIGDPVQVKKHTVLSTEDPVTPSNRTSFLYPFVAAVSLLCVLTLILLVVICASFMQYRRRKSHSSASKCTNITYAMSMFTCTVCTRVCLYTYKYVRVDVSMHVLHACMHICNMHVQTCVHTYVHVWVCVYA